VTLTPPPTHTHHSSASQSHKGRRQASKGCVYLCACVPVCVSVCVVRWVRPTTDPHTYPPRHGGALQADLEGALKRGLVITSSANQLCLYVGGGSIALRRCRVTSGRYARTVYARMHLCMSACMHVCMCARTCVRMCVYTTLILTARRANDGGTLGPVGLCPAAKPPGKTL
jgi:hypothetical protein